MITAFICHAQRVVFCMLLILLLATVTAQASIRYDAGRDHALRTQEYLMAETIHCMHDATVAALRRGVSDLEQIRVFNLKMCARPLYVYLTDTMGWAQEDAAELLLEFSDRTVINIGKHN